MTRTVEQIKRESHEIMTIANNWTTGVNNPSASAIVIMLGNLTATVIDLIERLDGK